MFDKMAAALHAQMLRANVHRPPSADILRYAMEIVANTVGIAALSFICGIITGHAAETAIVLVMFATIRFMSGGYHLRSGIGCVVVSAAVVTLIPLIPLSGTAVFASNAVSIVVMALKAPANYDHYARISRRYYPVMKAASCAVVAVNFAIVSDNLAIIYIIQSALLFFENKEGENR